MRAARSKSGNREQNGGRGGPPRQPAWTPALRTSGAPSQGVVDVEGGGVARVVAGGVVLAEVDGVGTGEARQRKSAGGEAAEQVAVVTGGPGGVAATDLDAAAGEWGD